MIVVTRERVRQHFQQECMKLGEDKALQSTADLFFMKKQDVSDIIFNRQVAYEQSSLIGD